MNIVYKTSTSNVNDIVSHLQKCDQLFYPRLSSIVDIEKYSTKIFNHAIRFEAWDSHELIGLVAAYFSENDRMVFITNVSVDVHFHRLGIAKKLIKNLIENIDDKKYSQIKLEVNESNLKAIQLYRSIGFEIVSKENDTYLMNKL